MCPPPLRDAAAVALGASEGPAGSDSQLFVRRTERKNNNPGLEEVNPGSFDSSVCRAEGWERGVRGRRIRVERVVGEGQSGRGGKAMGMGRMAEKKGRRQECNRKSGGRKAGVRRGETGGGEGQGEKGGEVGSHHGGHFPSHSLLRIPLRALQAVCASILGAWGKKGSTLGQGGRERMAGKCPPLESRLCVPVCLLGKTLLLHREI